MKKFTLTLLSLCIAILAFAVPAQRVAKVFKQADGTEITVFLAGDEAFHFYQTDDNVPLVREADGSFYYATVSANGAFVSTKMLAHNVAERSESELNFIKLNKEAGIDFSVSQIHKARAQQFTQMRKVGSTNILPEGVVNVPVLLVEYSDVKFSFTKEEMSDMFNKEGYSADTYYPNLKCIGSAKDYFIAQSGGKFIPNFVVSDIITLSNSMAYYGMNDSNGSDTRPTEMVRDACKKIDADYDFSQFDNNGDGEVEFIYVVYAGWGEAITGADPNTIWPHQWYMSARGNNLTLDGVKLDAYACSNECYALPSIGTYMNGIGHVCHEFSHCLGLPDFYDVNYNNMGMSSWSIMASGNYNGEGFVPLGYSAYEKSFVGWMELEELTEAGSYELEPLIESNKAYKIVNDANPDEFYVLENRVCEAWDKYMPAEGLMITHVDYDQNIWWSNSVNTTASRQRVTLIPADAKFDNSSLAGDLWPYKGNNELTDESKPAAKVYTGGYMGKPVTKITKEAGYISFDYLGGVFVEVPATAEATDITETGFTANWGKVDAAAKYNVELYKVAPVDTTSNNNGGDDEDAVKGAPIGDYVGKWEFDNWRQNEYYTSEAEISLSENAGTQYLLCKGFADIAEEYNYDDTFALLYDEATGLVNLQAQYVDSIMLDGVKYEVILYLANSQTMQVVGGTVAGGMKNGNIVFDTTTTSGYEIDCFVYVFNQEGTLYLLSYFNSLEWVPSTAASVAKVAKMPVMEKLIPLRKAEAEENVLLKEDFMGFTATNKSVGKNYDDYFSVPGWSGSNIFSEGGAMRIGTSKYAGSATTPTLSSNKMVEARFDVDLFNSSDNGVMLTVSYDVNGETTVLATESVKGAQSLVYEFIPGGDFNMTISTADGNNKRILVNGIEIVEKMGKVATLVESAETEETSYTFTDLEPDTEYKYRVRAIDADGNDSEYSEFVFVVLGTPTEIEDVTVDENEPATIYDVMGRKVDSITSKGLYIIRQGSKVTKILVK